VTCARGLQVKLAELPGSGLLPGGSSEFATVFEIDCDQAILTAPWLEQLLDAREHAEVMRLRQPLRRRRWAVLRGALRAILGVRLCIPPEQVPVIRTLQGRPQVAGPPACLGLGFSSTSRDGHGAIVVASCEGVGIDLERVTRERFPDHVASHLLHKHEMSMFEVLPVGSRPSWLATAWTTKEAVLKAIGCGLAVDPRTLVGMGPGASACLERDEPCLYSIAQFRAWRYRHGDVIMALATVQRAVTPRRVRLVL
jgi:4'-phosphopantetheinyl transferase